MDIIESLNEVKKQADLWDELNQDLSTKMLLINFPPKSTTTLRLIGPFQLVKRLYVEYEGFLVSKRECYDIAHGDVKAYDIVCKRVEEYLKKQNSCRSLRRQEITSLTERIQSVTEDNLLQYLERLYNNPYWQKCIMINAWRISGNDPFVDYGNSNDLRICCLTQKICSGMVLRTPEENRQLSTIPISGLFAHDVIIKRSGKALDVNYKMSFSKNPYMLNKDIIKSIISKGLWDFNKVVNELNQSGGRYVFKVSEKYRMPKELNDFIFSSYDKNEGEHFQKITNEIAYLPDEAIEGRVNLNNTIQSLEI